MLGREAADICVADPLVSRRHAVLEIYNPETILLKDLSSTNGTYHNGRLIDHCKLADGDEIRMGSSILNVLIDHPA
jgi:pSer/pThr/pTyr-binding forkhead associated (FHA) protein